MPNVKYVGLAFLTNRGIQAVSKAVGEAAAELQGAAVPITPFKSGTLQASIHGEGPDIRGNEATAKVATGGESSDYAIFVHEGTSRVAPSKFIERPLLSMIPVYQRYIEEAGRKAF
jgi:hypothetical protein